LILCESDYPKILDEISNFLTKDDFELVFNNKDEMRNLNFSTRNIDKSTDVLSFPYEKMAHFPIGSIVINLDEVALKSQQFCHSKDDEIALLFIHGALHILGYDHEKDSGEMREKECEIILKFNLPKSLIVRTQDSVEQ
jgi:metalloprotein, YbeY family